MPRNERLRKYRTLHNWRQQDLADQLQTSLVTIQRWERGDNHPTAYYRVKLCALFGASLEELGLLEESSSPTSPEEAGSEAAHVPVVASEAAQLWTVPYVRNRHFTGRAALLDHLMQQVPPSLTTLRGAVLPQPQAITGLGGIGKTQLAVEFAYRAYEQGHFTHTLWITAASEEAILSSFGALATLLPDFPARGETDQRKLVAAIIAWLEQCAQPWLLIFDNADTLSLLLPYLPHWGLGCVLITTRTSAVGSLAAILEVPPMSMQEGSHFLLRRAQRQSDASEEESREAGTLADALGQFPLALDQAGAYIEETGCSVQDYLQLYQQHRHTLLARRGSQRTGYPNSVATTWSLSFEHLAQHTPAAFELLRLCAFLSPDHIPEELLTLGAPYWPAVLGEAVTSRLTFDQLLQALLTFSLVKRLAEDHLLNLHRLVQVVQRESMPSEEQRQWAERVVRAVNAIFPPDPKNEVHTWPLCQRYLEQAEACSMLIAQQHLLLPEAAELLERVGIYLRERASYRIAEPFFQRALAIREQQVGGSHPASTAQSLHNLALLYLRQGRYAQAEPLFLRALAIWEQQAGVHHASLAQSLNSLASLNFEQGKHTQIESLFLRALAIWEQQVGPEHPYVAYPLNNLGNLYVYQGKYTQAESMFHRSLHIREQHLGLEHPDVASSLNGLANLCAEQGKYAQAEALYQRVLAIWEQQVKPEHPYIAEPLNNLGNLYVYQGKYTQAEPLLQRALTIRERQLGLEHPYVASSLNELANLSAEQGKYAQAEALYLRALHLHEHYLGLEHLETAKTMHDFARFQQAQGHTSEAVRLYQQVLTTREHVLGAEHFMTIDTRKYLHEIL